MGTLALTQYLDIVKNNLRLDNLEESEVILELRTHIEDKLEELKEEGLSEDEAEHTCVTLLGSAKMVAHQLYEAHSQGTWKQTLMASLPHLLFALSFALNWWQGFGWLLIVLTMIFGTAIWGWVRGKPNWLFPWLGYSLLPVIIAGLVIFYLPKGWAWVAIIIYIPAAAWLTYHFTVQTLKRDWLYSSLMLLPIPIVIAWFIAAGLNEQTSLRFAYLHYFQQGIGLSFLILALSVAFFVRIRKRWMKTTMLLISGILTLGLIGFYTEGRLGLPAFIVLIIVVLGLFVTPAVLEHRIRHAKPVL